MEKYSISKTAQLLSLSKDTLRYYDKIGLVQPSRGDNGYRRYSEDDLLTLQYVEVMKFAGISLSEIGEILQNRAGQSEQDRQNTLFVLRRKSEDIQRKIRLYMELEKMVHSAVQAVETKICPSDMAHIDEMVRRLYHFIGEKDYHEE